MQVESICTQKFNIEYNYNVFFNENIFSLENAILVDIINKGKKNFLVFIDNNVIKYFPSLQHDIVLWFKKHFDFNINIYTVEGGEKIKNDFHYVGDMLSYLLQHNMCRHSYLLIIGGGAVLDAASFAASIFHRGIRHIRIPTTVLSQADSAVGVKNSVNYFGLKNLIGTFNPPDAVINDSKFLESLNLKYLLCGVAEGLKVALIKDKKLYEFIDKNSKEISEGNLSVILPIIQESCKLHMDHIASEDPFEKGSSRPLDFGHWSAHKLESLSNNRIMHGEAVAIGCVLDTIISNNLQLLDDDKANRIINTFKKCSFKIYDELLAKKNEDGLIIAKGLMEFQEHLGGELTLAMLDDIGSMVNIYQLNEEDINKAISILEKL